MESEIGEEIPKHLRLVIEELDHKNITGAKFARQGNRFILLLDKGMLSKTNQSIINTVNIVYPNIVIAINDNTNPFDYEEVYESSSDKPNKKIRPYDIDSWYRSHEGDGREITEYFDRFKFTGIELDTKKISTKSLQLGFLLEFINAFKEQDVIGYESLIAYDEDSINRHERYIENGSMDSRFISLWVKYNEALSEESNGLKLVNDPYHSNLQIKLLNQIKGSPYVQRVQLTLERVNQNVKDYLIKKTKMHGNGLREQNIDITNQCLINEEDEIVH